MRILSVILTSGTVLSIACGILTGSHNGNSGVGATAAGTPTVARPEPATNDGKDRFMSEQTSNPISLKATAKNTTAGLLIEYTVENHTDQEQYVWDRMIKYEGNEQKIDDDGAYVFLVDSNVLNVIRADLPLPQAIDVARKEIPFARLLPPQGKLVGTVKLPHPVVEMSPYYAPPKEEQQAKATASEVVLMIGWTPTKPGMKISERTIGGKKVFAIRGAWAGPYQEVLQERLMVSVDVITYKDDFERQTPLR